ncbi:alpha/beta fold hydrolase [Massilia sp. KIM]|uniref:alpha/beta fold hydrolase n=1 Tax=Massilia sp. KIM TaxID=1955422 RepID=UPI00117E543E|nr:alpha/beta hydrolase [Massilia sp. KIM]
MKFVASLTLAIVLLVGLTMQSRSATVSVAVRPTIVLVHGAFADATSWSEVAAALRTNGYRVIGVANPLRSVKIDAEEVSNVVKSINGPVVLVGHSYGGSVISSAAIGNPNVRSLVYVAAFAPDHGETALELSSRFPGGTLGQALAEPVRTANGGKNLYIDQDKFHKQFAADLPKNRAALMAMSQRPIAEAALTEASGAPAWKSLPSYFIFGTGDKNIPVAALSFMAERAKSRKTVSIPGASHVVMISHSNAVARLIDEAAQPN